MVLSLPRQAKLSSWFLLFSFLANLLLPYTSHAQTPAYGLPQPTQILTTSNNYSLPVLKGIKINPKDPTYLEFIIDTKDKRVISQDELSRLVSYFMAALTVPEEDLWVNLSPYEQDRIMNDQLAVTDLGKDLLGEDYILKQLASSLTYPETEVGKEYWKEINNDRVGARHASPAIKGGTCPSPTGQPTQSFQKVWIVPAKALIYESQGAAIVQEAKLKVMTESDYVAITNSMPPKRHPASIHQHQGGGELQITALQGRPLGTNSTPPNPLFAKEGASEARGVLMPSKPTFFP